MLAATILRTSRVIAGLSQAAVAGVARTSQASVSDIENASRQPSVQLLDALLEATGHQLIPVRTLRATTADLASSIAAALLEGQNHAGLRRLIQLSDNLVEAEEVEAVILCASEPLPTGFAPWDAAIAAIVDFRLSQRRLPVPQWTEHQSRYLSQPDDFSDAFRGGVPDLSGVPEAFRRRGVHIEARELQSV